MRWFHIGWVCGLLISAMLTAQENGSLPNGASSVTQESETSAGQSSNQQRADEMPSMPGMDHGSVHEEMNMQPHNFLEEIQHHATSGTDAEPNSTPSPMWMTRKGAWMLMFHGNAFATDVQQSSARGGDKFFSTSWFMPMAQHKIGRGLLTLRTMFSLEPATITERRYPLLFQQGETAFGVPIADGQHPHNFFMEIAALYDWKLGEQSLLSFYAAPVGDPALGPVAYPHRASALENPVAPLGHHQEDSTHIADDVVTGGLTYRIARVEVSGFHGREPDENRWTITQAAIDSWSSRLTLQVGENWSGQYSYGRLQSPEALFPSEDQERMTASIMYNRPLRQRNWANLLLWGRTRSLADNAIFNSYLLESTLRFRESNYAWTRMENVDRSNELIVGENPLPANFRELPAGRVQAYTFGYDRDLHLMSHVEWAIGGQFTTFGVPSSLKPIYGSHPVGVAIFLRLRPFAPSH
jgi:hypothetical protein